MKEYTTPNGITLKVGVCSVCKQMVPLEPNFRGFDVNFVDSEIELWTCVYHRYKEVRDGRVCPGTDCQPEALA